MALGGIGQQSSGLAKGGTFTPAWDVVNLMTFTSF